MLGGLVYFWLSPNTNTTYVEPIIEEAISSSSAKGQAYEKINNEWVKLLSIDDYGSFEHAEMLDKRINNIGQYKITLHYPKLEMDLAERKVALNKNQIETIEYFFNSYTDMLWFVYILQGW